MRSLSSKLKKIAEDNVNNVQKCETEAGSFPTSCLSQSLKFQPLLLDACNLDNIQLFLKNLQHHLDHEASPTDCRNQRRQIMYLSGKRPPRRSKWCHLWENGFWRRQFIAECSWLRMVQNNQGSGQQANNEQCGRWAEQKKSSGNTDTSGNMPSFLYCTSLGFAKDWNIIWEDGDCQVFTETLWPRQCTRILSTVILYH